MSTDFFYFMELNMTYQDFLEFKTRLDAELLRIASATATLPDGIDETIIDYGETECIVHFRSVHYGDVDVAVDITQTLL